ATAFDGVRATRWWAEVRGRSTGWGATAYDTIGLLWVVGIVAAVYVMATMLTARIGGADPHQAPRAFAPLLGPPVPGGTIAQQFGLFVIEVQAGVALVSDPLGRGWDLFGTATRVVDLAIVSAATIVWVQAVALAAAHALAVVLVRERAVVALGPAAATARA